MFFWGGCFWLFLFCLFGFFCFLFFFAFFCRYCYYDYCQSFLLFYFSFFFFSFFFFFFLHIPWIVISMWISFHLLLSSSLVHFKNGLGYLTIGTSQVFITLICFLLQRLVSRIFLIRRGNSFLTIFISVWWFPLLIRASITNFLFL